MSGAPDTSLPAGSAATTGTNTGSPAAGGDTGATPPAAPIDWGQFNAGLERLGETFSSKLDALRGDVSSLPEHLRPVEPPTPPPDYDTMSQSELATHITGTILKSLESRISEMLAPVAQQLQHVQQTVTSNSVIADVKQMRSDHKDFNDWKDEMVGLARTHPTLGIGELYSLARASNADKAKRLDTHYNPPPPPPPPRWGGLTTTSTPGATGSTKPLSRDEANRAAYSEVSARHPGLLAALEAL